VTDLLDVNVLVALLVPEHQHHLTAVDWFETEAIQQRWATCRALTAEACALR